MSADTVISGLKTVGDWLRFREELAHGTDSAWKAAFDDFLHPRLTLRYFDPIKTLQYGGAYQGEGFSIVAIQCTLIEFLESTTQGVNYKFKSKGEKSGPFEYTSSQSIFEAFLCSRTPFSSIFDKASALDFYIGVRCGLLHEAQTKNGWKILGRSTDNLIANTKDRVVYRDNFQKGLLDYVGAYKEALLSDKNLQSAFIRKFDNICGAQPLALS